MRRIHRRAISRRALGRELEARLSAEQELAMSFRFLSELLVLSESTHLGDGEWLDWTPDDELDG